MPTDRSGLQILSLSACMELLANAPVHVGRVAVVDDGRPLVLPVNYRLDNGSIVFRTHAGSKLHAATAGSPVAFEADEVEPAFREGWSVIVHGHVEEITDPGELSHVSALPLRPWTPAVKERYLRIKPTSITGRLIG